MDDRRFVRLSRAWNLSVKPNDRTPPVDQKVHCKLQSPGSRNAQAFVSGRPKERSRQMRARKQDGLRQVFQVFDQVGQGLELDASFRNSFRHKRLDRHRSHEPNRRRSHKLSNLDQTEVFSGGLKRRADTVEFSPVDQIQRFACTAHDRYVVVPQVQILKDGLINRRDRHRK
jgi:hypothetical protein